MEREVSSTMNIAVMLLALSALIGIVWFTLVIGNGVKADAYEEGVDFKHSVSTSQLSSLNYHDNIIIPKAAAYNMLTQESHYVSYLEYTHSSNSAVTGSSSVKWTLEFKDDAWEAKTATGDTKYYNTVQDILSEDMHGKVEIYVESRPDDTYSVFIKDVIY